MSKAYEKQKEGWGEGERLWGLTQWPFHSELPGTPGIPFPSSPTSRQKCLIFYHQDFVALGYDLILAQSTNTIYGTLAMCLEWYWGLRLDSKKTQAHRVLDVRQVDR